MLGGTEGAQVAWCACFLRDEPPGSFPANSSCGKVAMRLFRIGKEKKMMKEIEIRDELHAPVSFGGGGDSGGQTSRYTGNSCTWSGFGKSVLEGAVIGGSAGAATGSVAPGGGTLSGAAIGGLGGAVTGGVAHELGCIW